MILLVIASGCGDDVTVSTDDAAAGGNPTIGTCPVDDLSIERVGDEKLGDWSLSVVLFTNDGDGACSLAEPDSAVISGSTALVPKDLAFVTEPAARELPPGGQAAIGVEGTDCDLAGGTSGSEVDLDFGRGTTVHVSLGRESCSLKWMGLMAWD